MKQRLANVLAVEMTCPTTIAVGDIAIINGDLTVIKLNAAGSQKIVGTVCAHEASATKCTIETRFRERRDDRLSGAAVGVGPFVYDANMKVIAFAPASHEANAVAGIVIKAAAGGDTAVETLEF